MRFLPAALLFITLPFTVQAYTPEISSLPTVAQLRVDPATIAPAISAIKNQPLRFAVGTTLGATTDAGTWDQPQAGVARWRLRVMSSDAKSLSFRLDALALPKDAALYLYSASGGDLQGPFTSRDNGTLWTPMVRADEAVLEARMPHDEKPQFSVTVSEVFHGYRAFRAQGEVVAKGALGHSGACEINVVCPVGDAWRKQIRATVLLSIGNQSLCSGTLVNNSSQDDRPLILTANHCGIDSSNITATKAYFNVEKSTCTSNIDGPINEVISGASIVAKSGVDTITDYTLIELATKPPSSYDVYYAGWDSRTRAPLSGATIHHPGGDDKKISLYTQGAQSVDDFCIGTDAQCRDGFKVDAWSIQWSQGSTEQGSSGSALFNQDGRIVGTLSGGDAQCSGAQSDGGTDYFARLDRAWTASSTTETTLKSALAANGNCSSLDGKEPGDASASSCDGSSDDGDGLGGGGGGFGWLSLLPLTLVALWRRRVACRRAALRALLVLGLIFPFASSAYTPELASLPTVAQIRLNPTTVKTALQSAKGEPLLFAVGTAMNVATDAGTWDEPQAGVARWRLRINSSGARALNFRFNDLQLPENAKLYVYTSDGADVQGPYTSSRNGRFITPLVRSEDAVIEARMPIEEKSQFSFTSATAFHAFREFSSKSFPNTSGTSGACEFDVACPVGRDYSDEIRSAVLLTIVNGLSEYLCSGSLVNNTAEDGRPLVLTANHCGVDSGNVGQTLAYFNVQRSACGGGTVGTVTQNVAGTAVLAGTSGKTITDYTLFELASKPPGDFDAYYSGWDIRGNAPASGAVIHHPDGDDKKISTYTQAAQKVDDVQITGGGLLGLGRFSVNSWGVRWASGTTEQGSSGSGLLDQNHRIIGTLSGGNGGCSGTSNNGGTDYFARLDQAWTASSVTGITMKSVLDPGNTGNSVLDGKDASKFGSNSGSSGGSSSSSAGDEGSSGGGSFGWLSLLPLAFAAMQRRRKAKS